VRGNREPRGRLGCPGRGSGFPRDLDLVFDLLVLPGWVLFCGAGVFLTSAARSGGEVRKTEAERAGRHPARPAAVAAVMWGHTGPAGAHGPLGGPRAAGVWPRAVAPGASQAVTPGTVPAMSTRARRPPVCPYRQYRYSAPGVATTLYSRLAGVTDGLGVASTLTWNGRSKTAPEIPRGSGQRRDEAGREQLGPADW